MSYSEEQVNAALNRAADDILVAIDAPDEGVRDAINLLVNAGLTYLREPKATLMEAIEENYSLDPEEIAEGGGPLEWAQR